jgi:cell wall-associated NlpC family hydrolase
MTEEQLILKYLGIPYQHQGRVMTGLDCYGLIIAVYADLGHELLDIDEDYSEKWSWKGKNLFIENYHKQWMFVNEAQVFDVVLLGNSKGIANHAGIMLKDNRVLHTCRAGTVVSRLEDLTRMYKFMGFYRLRV